MKVISSAMLSALFCTVVSASLKVKKEKRTAFFGEDIYIDIPPGNLGEVVFEPKHGSEVPLMKEGKVLSPRCHINSLGHLVVEDVQEEDEGVYVIRNTNSTNTAEHLILEVRNCALEEVVNYGGTYRIFLKQVEGPITLEFRPSPIQTNHTEILHATEPPPVVLYNQTAVVAEDYVRRLSVSERQVTLHSVRMMDEGSFTVLDREGKVRRRNCLKVREYHVFSDLSYGADLKMKLYLDHSLLNIVYIPKTDNRPRAVLDQGVLVSPLDPMLEGRVSVSGSELIMKKLHVADIGYFKVTDMAGFLVANVYIDVKPYKLPPLTVAVLSLLGLIAFMLLVCLLSCVYRVHKRNEKNKKLLLVAQQAGKGDGEAFRQVVHEAYTRFAEESLMQSVSDKTPETTEVTIKGLEVSKPGRYQALTSDTFMEMSDSGVEFTHPSLPLDSDTDAGMTYASHKPLLNAVSPTAVTTGVLSDSMDATLTPHGDLSASRTPDSVLSASPASNPRSLAAATPDGSLGGAASPGAASRGTAGSDSAKTEGGVENGEAGQMG